ncbi:glycosyltransferase [Terribacillus aidingensis]|uniref:glycosyltransferase n=1 Tax=Terribacillus aidingensis TaxID=586416 RepID=UPI00344D694C
MLKNKKILFASHTLMNGPFVVGSHHLARELSKQNDVIHLSSPVTPLHFAKWKDKVTNYKLKRSLRNQRVKINDNLIDIVPFSLIPWKMSRHFFNSSKLNYTCSTMIPGIKSDIFQHVDVLILDQPSFIGIESIINPKITIYRPTDLYTDMEDDEVIRKAEALIMNNADALIGTSEPVLNKIRLLNKKIPRQLIENGVEFEHFNTYRPEPKDYAHIKGPKAVYMGAIDKRLDMNAIFELARGIPELNLILIGPYEEKDIRLIRYEKNIFLFGTREYRDLPGYLQAADIGLLPLSDHPSNQGRSPMKLYEYAASGIPVVAKKTTELERRKDNFISIYSDYKELINTVKRLLDDASLESNVIKEEARKYSWENRALLLSEFIEGLNKL